MNGPAAVNGAFAGQLVSGQRRLGRELPTEVVGALAVYAAELEKWAKKVNLIAKGTTPTQLVESHFIDSLNLLPLLPPGTGPGERLLDIGSGAGFPGLVCAVARPALAITLVEPRQKRAAFLRHMVRTLGLAGVEVRECRVEDKTALPGPYSHITARAVTDLAGLLAMAARFAPGETQLLWLKGPKWQEELAAAGEVLAASPYRLSEVVEARLPFSGACRSILLFRSGLNEERATE